MNFNTATSGAGGGVKKSPAPSSQQATSPSLMSPSAFQFSPEDIMEMEDWEVAPGIITEAGGSNADTMAFSKPYLSGTKPIRVNDDVTFRVRTIHPGQTWQLAPDVLKTRVCSLAAGKVRVQIGNEPEFVIGPHGMFRVKSGTTCAVKNWMYSDAVLHITGVAEYEM